MHSVRPLLAGLLMAASGCGAAPSVRQTTTDGGTTTEGIVSTDGGVLVLDAGSNDAGATADAGPIDLLDAGMPSIDAGWTEPPDSGPAELRDAGPQDQPDSGPTEPPDAGPPEPPDAGPTDPPDAGPTDPPDAGPTEPPDAGPTDPPDAGVSVPDAGMGFLPVQLPSLPDWTFYGPDNGGPNQVYGASYDEGGNLWVAGGEQGLYVLRAGESYFQHFTMTDGLHPYGYMPDGSEVPGAKYLKVISVSGGWAGTAFVGYQGKPGPSGPDDCEGNWDGDSPDPSIYKSGDADRVTLDGAGIQVVHYDIFSGPGIVGDELRGREKLCHIYRIRYDKVSDKVWFGGNHGFAMGDAHYAGNANCQWESSLNPPVPTKKTDPFSNEYGHHGCNGLLEHVHPALNAARSDGTCCVLLTGYYYGVSVDPVTKDVWFGGIARTTRFHYGATGGDYYKAQSQTEDSSYISNRIDIWPDKVEEPNIPKVSDRVDDQVSGAAAMNDGTVWISSFARGLAHLDAKGNVLQRLTATDGLVATKLSSIVADPLDQSVWVGPNFGGGLTRLLNGTLTQYPYSMLGDDLGNEGISDLQSWGTGSTRKIVVSFSGDDTRAGAVGVYSGR